MFSGSIKVSEEPRDHSQRTPWQVHLGTELLLWWHRSEHAVRAVTAKVGIFPSVGGEKEQVEQEKLEPQAP